MTRSLKPPPYGKYSIVCPYCFNHDIHDLSDDSVDLICPRSCCGRVFQVSIMTVRAKRSKALFNHREFIIRVVTHHG